MTQAGTVNWVAPEIFQGHRYNVFIPSLLFLFYFLYIIIIHLYLFLILFFYYSIYIYFVSFCTLIYSFIFVGI